MSNVVELFPLSKREKEFVSMFERTFLDPSHFDSEIEFANTHMDAVFKFVELALVSDPSKFVLGSDPKHKYLDLVLEVGADKKRYALGLTEVPTTTTTEEWVGVD